MKKFILVLMVFVANLFASGNYTIDENSSNAYFKSQADILFFVDDEIIGVNRKLSGSLIVENENINGKILIDSSMFSSQNETRDTHISEILNYQKFNHIIIDIEEEVLVDDKLYLKTKLFINGVSKRVDIEVKKKDEKDILTYTGKVFVKYSDFNIEAPTIAGFIKKAKDSLEIGARVIFKRVSNDL